MYQIIVCLIACFGAGVGTGLAGLSAAAVISPMLIGLLNTNPYEAVGIALASDVLASAISALTYAKNKKIDIKNGLLMMLLILCFTFVGSYLASLTPSNTMGNFSMFMTLLLGFKFLFQPVKKETIDRKTSHKNIKTILFGILIGLVCGFIGAGGGMMILLALTSILGYDLKTAVGTSVFIMTFTAFTGALSHFMIGDLPDITLLVECIVFTFIFARISSNFANKTSVEILNKVVGIVLVAIGILMVVIKYIF